MHKKPIDSLERFYAKVNSETDIADIIVFNSKQLKKLLKEGYYIHSLSELWYDGEEGLSYNNWIEEYEEGIWGMSQKDVEKAAKDAIRRFSHLTRRSNQKIVPRVYKTTNGMFTMIYLYMRDRMGCDYMIFLKKRGIDDEV